MLHRGKKIKCLSAMGLPLLELLRLDLCERQTRPHFDLNRKELGLLIVNHTQGVMSGIETITFGVLGVLPLVISAAEHYVQRMPPSICTLP